MQANKQDSPQICCTALQRSSQQRKGSTNLDRSLPTQRSSSPHNKKRANGAARAVDSICGRDSFSRLGAVTRLALLGQVEETVPSWLSDCAANDGRAVAVCLDKMSTMQLDVNSCQGNLPGSQRRPRQ